MSGFRSEFLRTLDERGFIHQVSDPALLDERCAAGPITGYIGFDCTADSLHAGSLVQIMLLRWLQKTGHRPIVLLGGGTTKIGDPSGKDETRKLLSEGDIARNSKGIRQIFARYLQFGEGTNDAQTADNAEWLDSLVYIAFLREYGRHFTINRMLTFDSVKLRLEREQPLTFLEFNYMILQAYDFLELARRHECILQMGGSDQWGNIINGVELGRRADQRQLFALTSPLLTASSGAKMGKTAQGAVWLNPERLSPYGFWQYWRNTEDADVGRFLRLFTELPLPEIARLEVLGGTEINEAKKILATAATALAHGAEAAASAAETARKTFEEHESGADLPIVEIARHELETGIALFNLLHRAGLAASGGEARRLVKGGGARVNGSVAESETRAVTIDDVGPDGVIKLSAGKKRHAMIRAI
jgi:tyrosyl-tRNA synthetase